MESWIGQAVQKNNFIADPVVTEKRIQLKRIFSREGLGRETDPKNYRRQIKTNNFIQNILILKWDYGAIWLKINKI